MSGRRAAEDPLERHEAPGRSSGDHRVRGTTDEVAEGEPAGLEDAADLGARRGLGHSRAEAPAAAEPFVIPVRGRSPIRRVLGIHWAGILPFAVVVVAAFLCAALITAVLVREERDQAASARSASGYTAPSVGPSTPPPSTAASPAAAGEAGPLQAGQTVSVVSDEYLLPNAGGTGSWSTTTANALRVDTPVRIAAGYVSGLGAAAATSSYAARAAQIAADSSVVVFAGGAGDADASSAEVALAAGRAFSAAATRAPSAHLIVIGPIHTGGRAPAALLRARDAIRTAALAAGADWYDPIGGDWFSSTPGATLDDDLTSSDAAQPVIAARLQAALRGLE